MKKLLVGSVILASTSAIALPAAAGDVSVTATIDYTSDYVFRGVSLADSAIQPGVEVAFGDAYVGGWFSTGVGDTSILAGDEVDLYAGYGLSLSDTLGLDVGVTYYHYPQGGGLFETDGGGAGTYEVYAGLALDTVASPSVYAYYDLTLEALTLEGGLGHTLPLSDDFGIDLGVTGGLVDGDGFSYEYGQATAALSYAFTEDVSAYISGNLAVSSEDTLDYEEIVNSGFTAGDSSLFFVGAGVSAGF